MKRLFTIFFTILGGLVGYEVFDLLRDFLTDVEKHPQFESLTASDITWIGILIVIVFILIFYQLAPAISRGSKKVATNLETNLRNVSAHGLMGGAVGVIMGLIMAYLISGIYSMVIANGTLKLTISIILYAVFAFLGGVIGSDKIGEVLQTGIATLKKTQSAVNFAAENDYGYSAKDKRTNRVPKILDTSVIIDGRILEIMKTGFLEGPIVIPEFVLVELRHIADSSDALKRAKGRRGLDILKKIQEEYGIEIYNTDAEKGLKDIPEVDVKLLKLAQNMKGRVVTNDFNLNKVAQVKGIGVLNINELSNAVKPIVLPGENMSVTLIKQGKDRQQAIGYLEDGTMIVVEEGRRHIGETVDIVVTSALQTAAGRMIFGKVK